MARRHIRLKEVGWKLGLFVNGLGAIATGVVTIVIGATKFMHGAWVIVLLVPIMVYLLVRLNHQYESEKEELNDDAQRAATAPIMRRHSVIVLIDRLDRTSARAIQYARTLSPDDLRAVHIAIDEKHADELADEWVDLPLATLPLEIRECPDRRINRTVLELCTEVANDGQTEVSVLIPRRVYRAAWHKLLHDRTADSISRTLSDVPHVNVTFVPYHLTRSAKGQHVAHLEHGNVSGTTDIHN